MGKLKKRRNGGNLRGPVILLPAVLLLIYMICRFTLSYSDEVGQAEKSLSSIMMSRLSIKIMESGSSLIRYQSEKKESEDFLMGMLTREFPAYDFTGEERSLEALFQEPAAYQMGDNPLLNHKEGLTDPSAVTQASLDTTSSEQAEGIGFYDITQGKLSKEYILTNGAAYDSNSFLALARGDNRTISSVDGQLTVGIMDGEVYNEETDDKTIIGQGSDMEVMRSFIGTTFTMEDLKDINFLMRNFYIVDPDTRITDELFDSEILLGKDMTIRQKNDAPQILIYHTHSHEAFADSREGEAADTVVGIGNYLAQILEDQYGYNVIHDTTAYDKMSKGDANLAYNYTYDGISKILEENPSIEVMIDVHRDGADKPRSTILEGQETAQIMLYNGLSRNQKGPLTKLDNPYQKDNLAFSFQMQLNSLEKYPKLIYRNYLNSYRYNLHLRPKSMLIEVGTDKNSVASARNAMNPFAEVLDEVLQGQEANR